MKRIYSAETLMQVAHMQNLLASHGIEAQMRNTTLTGGLGEIPMLETWPQLWVEDELAGEAKRVVELELRAPPRGEAWTCRSCGERIEGQFTECWRCSGSASAS